MLQNKGVFGNLTFIEELPSDIYPFDNDLMSMELGNGFKVQYVNRPTFNLLKPEILNISFKIDMM